MVRMSLTWPEGWIKGTVCFFLKAIFMLPFIFFISSFLVHSEYEKKAHLKEINAWITCNFLLFSSLISSYTNNGTGKSGRRQRQTIHTPYSEGECMYGKINSNRYHYSQQLHHHLFYSHANGKLASENFTNLFLLSCA